MAPLIFRFQAQLGYADSNAAELETCKLGEPYLIGRGVNPTFEQPYAVSDQPAHPNPVIYISSVLKWSKKSKWLARYAN